MRSFVGLLFVTVLAEPRAGACRDPDYALESWKPDDGATGVPTNVQARVTHAGSTGHDDLAGDLAIRPAGGAPVAATITVLRNAGGPQRVFIVRPGAPLAPHTTHELLGRVRPNCAHDCAADPPVVLATFTTGAGPDTTAPTFTGIERIDVTAIPDFHRCLCGPGEGAILDVRHGEASDDSAVAGYHVYFDDQLVSAAGTRGHAFCDTYPTLGLPDVTFFKRGAGRGRYSVRAVDLAGNEDQNLASVSLDLACAPVACRLTPDAGPPSGPDAPPPALAGGEAEGGCAVGGGGAASGIWIALLATWSARRRRRWSAR
jgi:hypothetical protein